MVLNKRLLVFLRHSLAVVLSLVIFFGLIGIIGFVFTQQIVDLAMDPTFLTQVQNASFRLGDSISDTMGLDVHELQRPVNGSTIGANGK